MMLTKMMTRAQTTLLPPFTLPRRPGQVVEGPDQQPELDDEDRDQDRDERAEVRVHASLRVRGGDLGRRRQHRSASSDAATIDLIISILPRSAACVLTRRS